MPETPANPTPSFPRPSTSDLAIWVDLRMVLAHVNTIEYYLGRRDAEPLGGLDVAAVRSQLNEARRLLGTLALAHAESIVERS